MKDNIHAEFVRSCLKELRVGSREVGISLNLPYFFTNLIKVPKVAGEATATILATKIQAEFPLPADKYFRAYQEIAALDSLQTFLVMFYHRNILESLEKVFLQQGLLPVVIEPSFLSVLRYLTQELTLEVDKTYFVVILYSMVLTGFIFDNGTVKNTFTEFVGQAADINQSLLKFIEFSLQKFSLERIRTDFGGLLIVSETAVNLEMDFKVINIGAVAQVSPAVIIGSGLSERVGQAPVADNEILLNPFSPVKDFFYLRLARILLSWSVVLVGLSLATAVAFRLQASSLKETNNYLRTNLTSPAGSVEQHKDDLKQIVILLRRANVDKNIPTEIFPILKTVSKFGPITTAAFENRVLFIQTNISTQSKQKLTQALKGLRKSFDLQEGSTADGKIDLEISVKF